MTSANRQSDSRDELRETAATWFLARQSGEAETFDGDAFEAWLHEDPAHAAAFDEVETAWAAVGEHATAPEVVVARRDALERVRVSGQRRWGLHWSRRYFGVAAVAASLLVAVALAVYFSPGAQQAATAQIYATDIGEQRSITLEDNSRIALDAKTRLQVDYSVHARAIELFEGQAHFDVARDTLRPFSVKAGDQTVVALGTQFNVEIVDEQVLVTLLEGRVEVTAPESGESATGDARSGEVARVPKVVELSPGEQLVVAPDGSSTTFSGVNTQKTVSWRQGKLVFDDEPLVEAIARVNRHSRIVITASDPLIRALPISGVFDAGNSEAFVEAVVAYYPSVESQRSGQQSVVLRAKTN